MLIAETRRMLIRELTSDDVPELAGMLGDSEVMRYSIRGVCTEDDTRQFVKWCMASYAENGYGPWALVEKGSSALVGFCGLSPESVDGVEETHIGYRLAHRFWGQGLATEAAAAVLAYGFACERLTSVIAIIEPDHVASLRVAEKAGFNSFVCAHFHGRDVRVYRKTLREWAGEMHHNGLNPPGSSAGAPGPAG